MGVKRIFAVTVDCYTGQESGFAFLEQNTQRNTENPLGWWGNVDISSADQAVLVEGHARTSEGEDW